MVDPYGPPAGPFFEASTTLAAMALQTSRIRVGTLITSLIYRHPGLIAKAAMTIDHLSGGRLELAIGGGAYEVDHRAAGGSWRSAGERVERVREGVHLIDLLLRNEVTTWEGRYYRVDGAQMIPGPLQRPRPRLTIAAHEPRMLRVAARYADCWSSWGGDNLTEEEMFRLTRERARRFEDACAEFGRDPARLGRQFCVYPPLAAWASPGALRDIVGRYGEIGIDEFVLYWPETRPETEVFERAITDVMPALRRV